MRRRDFPEWDGEGDCPYCGTGDPVPPGEYWLCPVCDAEWQPEDDDIVEERARFSASPVEQEKAAARRLGQLAALEDTLLFAAIGAAVERSGDSFSIDTEKFRAEIRDSAEAINADASPVEGGKGFMASQGSCDVGTALELVRDALHRSALVIRRPGDYNTFERDYAADANDKALALLPARPFDPVRSPGHTDLMVSPEAIDRALSTQTHPVGDGDDYHSVAARGAEWARQDHQRRATELVRAGVVSDGVREETKAGDGEWASIEQIMRDSLRIEEAVGGGQLVRYISGIGDAAEGIRQALASPPLGAAALPDEPTRDMWEAFDAEMKREQKAGRGSIECFWMAYAAMCRAAPPSPLGAAVEDELTQAERLQEIAFRSGLKTGHRLGLLGSEGDEEYARIYEARRPGPKTNLEPR